MNITLCGAWTNNIVQHQITESLTPLQKKVVMVFAAFLALATVGFLCYACYRTLTHKQIVAENTTKQTQVPVPNPPAVNVVKLEDRPASEGEIAIGNADEIRARIENPAERINLKGQWRVIYFDTSGLFLGLKGSENLSSWIDNKAIKKRLIAVNVTMHKWNRDPSKQPEAFEYQERDLEQYPVRLKNIVKATVHELNQFANGAYNLAKNANQDPNTWLNYFKDPQKYTAATLYNAKSTPASQPIQANAPAIQVTLASDSVPQNFDSKKGTKKNLDRNDQKPNPSQQNAQPAVPKATKEEKTAGIKATLRAEPDQQNTDSQQTKNSLPNKNDQTAENTQQSAPTSSQKLTIAQRLQKNRDFAAAQQKNESAKGFTLDWSPIPETYESNNGDVPLEGELYPKNELGVTLVGTASCQGHRLSMEDATLVSHFTFDGKGGPVEADLLGIFDGHGGADASKFVQDNLIEYLKKALKEHCNQALTEDEIFLALKKCCKKLDDDYKVTGDGTTATIALIIGGKLYIANVGDSRTIYVNKQEKAIQASEDAKPTIDRYQRKIEKLGGFVALKRVNGLLAVARAIGDKQIAANGQCLISPNPKITSYPIDDCKFIVLACDGLYDVATTDEVGKAINEMNRKGITVDEMAKRLVWSALKNNSKDNISVVVCKVN